MNCCEENESEKCGCGSSCESFFPTIGESIPDFSGEIYHGEAFKKVNLSDYKGKWLILFFYPADFTFVCPTELEDLAENYSTFQELNAEVLSVSTDTVFVHKAWHDHSEAVKKVSYPMFSDPTGNLSRIFGVYIEGEGVSLRGTFLVDPDGVLQGIEVNANNIGRSSEELLRKLRAAQFVREHGGFEVCPAKWKPGNKSLKPSIDLVGKI
ncbi:MAG: peroxiredoxin [Candidatus Moranbacteria bacterium]|nr:peroxiredoxin [Candidatus Moranbacteria bacterium]